MTPLTPKRRSELRAEAHKLAPVVIIGDKGLTDEVVAEIDRTLKAHELIKVRAATDDRKARDAWLAEICDRLQAHPVQQIGKVFVIYREKPAEDARKANASADARAEEKRRRAEVVSERGRKAQRARDAEKQRLRDAEDMKRKGKIPANVKLGSRVRGDEAGAGATRTSRPRSRTPAPPLESAPRRRRPRTSR